VDSINEGEIDQEFVRSFQRLVGAVFRLNGQLLKTAEGLSADLDVSTTRWQAISVIRHQPLTVSQIARRIGISRQSARQTVQRLEESGLVEFSANPDHLRSPLLTLTDEGNTVMEVLRKRQDRLTHRFTDGLGMSIESIDQLTEQLEKLRAHAEELDADE